jgi:aminoglycoside phosphotransferase
VVGVLSASDSLGSGYVMVRAQGSADPAKILPSAPEGLIGDIAGQLAQIHAIQLDDAVAIPHQDTAQALAEFKSRFSAYGGDRPIIALAIKWCEDNIPEPALPSLVHGDYRMGNLMVDETGLTAVLDWELAHFGDRHDDIAYGCLNVWRFGQVDKPAYGIATFEEFFAAYEAAGGGSIDLDRFHFWMIFRTLWWALGCLQMADYWRSGADRSLERAVIGRRTSENELDLLMLLEDAAPDCAKVSVSISQPAPLRTMGEPSALEMLEAVREWIASDVKANAEGRGKFMAAVAMNALSMVQRELANPVDIHNKALCDAILVGEQSLSTPGLLTKLRGEALAKLSNDVPKYAALQIARAKWS